MQLKHEAVTIDEKFWVYVICFVLKTKTFRREQVMFCEKTYRPAWTIPSQLFQTKTTNIQRHEHTKERSSDNRIILCDFNFFVM